MEENRQIQWPGWEIGQVIGRGGYGSVYAIERKISDTTERAALKVITIPRDAGEIEELYSSCVTKAEVTEMFREYKESLLREYAMMAEMKGCANIVYCDDFRAVQHSDGIGWDVYLKMELLTPLRKRMEKGVSEAMVRRLGMDICRALVFCEEKNVIHRDIKPGNIFVAPDGSFKLGDFGIARTVEAATRATRATRIGTEAYMAPEVYFNRPYDARTDLYALGLVLYELMNNYRRPFEPTPPALITAAVRSEALDQRLSGTPLPPPAHGSDALKAIVLKACAFDPAERFASAQEMLQALSGSVPAVVPAAASAHEAKAQTSMEKEKKEVNLLAVILAVLLVLGGAALVGSWIFNALDPDTGGSVSSGRRDDEDEEPEDEETEPEEKEPLSPEEERFRQVEEDCWRTAEEASYLEALRYLREAMPQDASDSYIALQTSLEDSLRADTLARADEQSTAGNYLQAYQIIAAVQQEYDCPEFQCRVEIYRTQLSVPLTRCYLVDDSDEVGGVDVAVGSWWDVYSQPHMESIRFWVIQRTGWSNAEYSVYSLGGKYATLSGTTVMERNSESGAKCRILIYLDGKLAWESGDMTAATEPQSFELDVTGVQSVKILCQTDTNSFCYCVVDASVSEI